MPDPVIYQNPATGTRWTATGDNVALLLSWGWLPVGTGSAIDDALDAEMAERVADADSLTRTALDALGISVPDSTTTVKGLVELATTAEATTGTDTARAVTPAGLKAATDALGGGLVYPQDAPSTVVPGEGTVLFDADLDSGTLAAYASTIHPEHAYIEDDPVLGAARKVVRMTVLDTDTVPTENPRVQLETAALLDEYADVWMGWSTYFPADWPDLPADGWVTIASVYGPPFGGSGPNSLTIGGAGTSSPTLRWGLTFTDAFPLLRATWMDFCVHLVMSPTPGIGIAEVFTCTDNTAWVQRTIDGRHTAPVSTLLAGINDGGANDSHLALYRKVGMFTSMTLYHADHKLATTFESAAPGSYPTALKPWEQ